GFVKLNLVLVGDHQRHHPILGWLMPENFWITEILPIDGEDGILLIALPGPAVIVAEGKTLVLQNAFVVFVNVRSINSNQAGTILTQSAGIVFINKHRSGEDHDAVATNWVS